jgi:3-phosphoshikimate 1-carboxyvinyltransferase
VTVCGELRGGEFVVRGDVSSQFLTGLLFALPLCREDSVLRILPPLHSRPYLDLTLQALAAFGVRATWEDALTLRIPGGQAYGAADAAVEADCSNAAFFAALPLLGHDVTVTGLPAETLQGDRVFADYFRSLEQGRPTLPLHDCPDLGPILMALAAARNGAVLTGTARLRDKESDRGAAMAEELAKLGAEVTVTEDSIEIEPCALHAPTVPLSAHGDHRVAMALCTLLTKTGGILDGAEAVRKSDPDYFLRMRALGLAMRPVEPQPD